MKTFPSPRKVPQFIIRQFLESDESCSQTRFVDRGMTRGAVKRNGNRIKRNCEAVANSTSGKWIK